MEIRWLLTQSEITYIERTEKDLKSARKKICNLQAKISEATTLFTNIMYTAKEGCTATTDRISCNGCVFVDVCTHKNKHNEDIGN